MEFSEFLDVAFVPSSIYRMVCKKESSIEGVERNMNYFEQMAIGAESSRLVVYVSALLGIGARLAESSQQLL